MRLHAGADREREARSRGGPGMGGHQGRGVARGDPRRAARRGRRGTGQCGRRAAHGAPPVPARGRALAVAPLAARPRRLPRRRHGPREDRPGPRAPAPLEAASRDRGPSPPRRPRLAPRELEGGGRALRAVRARARRPPIGDAEGGAGRARAGGARGARPRHRELRRRPPLPVARRDELRARGPRRGAGHQEPRGAADPRGEGTSNSPRSFSRLTALSAKAGSAAPPHPPP